MDNNISDFIKIAYEHNKVKELKDAFEEFPVEQEWHKGRIENVVCEERSNYDSTYKIGDIVFVREYKYNNGNKGNNHLFVIIDQNNLAVPIENFGMLISSNLDKLRFNSNVLLEKDEINHLKKDSLVKTDVIYRILNEQILFKIGTVEQEKIEVYKKSFSDDLI